MWSEIFSIPGLDYFWKSEVICPGFAKATPGDGRRVELVTVKSSSRASAARRPLARTKADADRDVGVQPK